MKDAFHFKRRKTESKDRGKQMIGKYEFSKVPFFIILINLINIYANFAQNLISS